MGTRVSHDLTLSFFFQAEDGIRYAQESRGLGDVYKRQVSGLPAATRRMSSATTFMLHLFICAANSLRGREPVSYTHLTLPTIYSV